MITDTPQGAPAMKTTGTITMTMREVDRLKVIEAVTDFGPTFACEKPGVSRHRHGARSVISGSKHLPEQSRLLLTHRPTNVVAAALVNKMARTICALLAYGRTYQATPTWRSRFYRP
jgi:hypothetical protein